MTRRLCLLQGRQTTSYLALSQIQESTCRFSASFFENWRGSRQLVHVLHSCHKQKLSWFSIHKRIFYNIKKAYYFIYLLICCICCCCCCYYYLNWKLHLSVCVYFDLFQHNIYISFHFISFRLIFIYFCHCRQIVLKRLCLWLLLFFYYWLYVYVRIHNCKCQLRLRFPFNGCCCLIQNRVVFCYLLVFFHSFFIYFFIFFFLDNIYILLRKVFI